MAEALDGQADPRLEVFRALGAGQTSLGQWGQDRSLWGSGGRTEVSGAVGQDRSF